MANITSQKADLGDLIARSFTHPGALKRFFDLPDIEIGEGASFAVDIKEYDDSYRIVADVPGFDKGDISIGLENNILTISAQKVAETSEKDEGKFVRRERSSRSFVRSFHLPEHIDEAKVEARLDAGVLDLTLPKSAAAAKRRIEVK